MRRREWRPELRRYPIAQRERRCAVVAHGRAALRGAAEVVDAQRIAFARCNTLEADDDSLFLTGVERKDSRAQQPVSHPFDERGIALGADDVLIDAARFAGIHCFAGDELTV